MTCRADVSKRQGTVRLPLSGALTNGHHCLVPSFVTNIGIITKNIGIITKNIGIITKNIGIITKISTTKAIAILVSSQKILPRRQLQANTAYRVNVGGRQRVERIRNVRNFILWMGDLMRNQVNTVWGKIGV